MPYRKPHSFFLHPEDRLLQLIILVGAALLLVVMIQILLPWLALAAVAGVGLWLQRRQQQQQQALHRLFYEILKTHQGRVSVLDFAIAADLTGRQARTFLDARAREFYANFEPTEHGDILYTFRSPGIQGEDQGDRRDQGDSEALKIEGEE